EQLLFDHPPHQVGSVDRMRAVAELALKAVRVEQRHEKLKILLLAVMRRGGEQQKVARDFAEQLAQLVSLRRFNLAAEKRRRQLVRLVADDYIPVGVFEPRLHIFVAAELIQTTDDVVHFGEGVAGASGLHSFARHYLERQLEFLVEFVLPLLNKAARTADQT